MSIERRRKKEERAKVGDYNGHYIRLNQKKVHGFEIELDETLDKLNRLMKVKKRKIKAQRG